MLTFQKLLQLLGLPYFSAPPQLTGRAHVVAILDTWSIGLTQKQQALANLEHQWIALKRQDGIFSWFNEKNRTERCAVAWEWLCSNEPYSTYGKAPIDNYEKLISFFDATGWSEAEKTLRVLRIKRRWSQKSYREKLKNKKQYNFMLSDEINKKLDGLAEKYNLKRNHVLETLIQMEAAQELYIPEQLRAATYQSTPTSL